MKKIIDTILVILCIGLGIIAWTKGLYLLTILDALCIVSVLKDYIYD